MATSAFHLEYSFCCESRSTADDCQAVVADSGFEFSAALCVEVVPCFGFDPIDCFLDGSAHRFLPHQAFEENRMYAVDLGAVLEADLEADSGVD